MEIQDILDTPFMLNIVVQVLPQMGEILSSQNYIKDSFKSSFIIEKRNQIQSIINMYKSNNSFVTISQQYTQEEINELQTYVDKQNSDLLSIESIIIWNRLIESSFFKQFSIMLQFDNIIKLLEQQDLKENITKKERDIDNQFIIYKALISKKSTIYEFYQFFFNNYTERQRMKLIYNNDIKDLNQFQIDVQNYAIQFAVTMTIQNKTSIEMKPKGILFRAQQETGPFEKLFQDLDQHANYRNLIRKCLPLKQKANFYSFNHKTIQEYLFAKEIIDFLISIDQNIDQLIELRNKEGVELQEIASNSNAKIKQYKECTLNQVNLEKSQLFGAFKFIKMTIKYNEGWQEVCYKLALLSSIFPQLLRLSSNSFYILINVKAVLEKKDFSKIFISDISLKYGIFKKCNFKFQRVEIYGINFSNIDLSKIDWNDVYTNDLPTQKVPNGIQSICFSYDSKQIIGGDWHGMIYVWDKQSSQLIKQIESNSGGIYYINKIRNKIIISLCNIQQKKVIKVWDGKYKLIGSDQLLKDELVDDPCSLFTHNNNFIGMIVLKNAIRANTISDFKLYKQRDFDEELVKIKIMEDQDIGPQQYGILIMIKQKKILTNINKHYPPNPFGCLRQSIFSFDCKLLILQFDYDQQNLKVFDLQKKQFLELRIQHQITRFYLSNNNKYLALVDEMDLYVYDIFTQSRLFEIINQGYSVLELIQFNQESTELITLYPNNAKLWDLEILMERQSQKEEFFNINLYQISSDGLLIYYSKGNYSSEELYVASTKTGEQQEKIVISFFKFQVCLSGKYIYYIDTNYNLIKYNINSKKQDQLSQQNQFIYLNTINQSHDYRLLTIENQNKHQMIILLNDHTTKIQSVMDIGVGQIQFSYDRNYLYFKSADKKNEIQLFSINYQVSSAQNEFLQNLSQPKIIHQKTIEQFFITLDDEFIIALDQKNKLYKWNIRKQETVQILETYGRQIRIFNKYLMVWDIKDKNIFFYDVGSLQLMAQEQNLKLSSNVFLCDYNKMMISIEGRSTYIFTKIWKINKKFQSKQCAPLNLWLIIPKNRNDDMVLQNVKWEDSKIQCHLNFDLKKYWTQNIE